MGLLQAPAPADLAAFGAGPSVRAVCAHQLRHRRAFHAGGPVPLLEAAERLARQPLRHAGPVRSEEHTSELQSPCNLVCRLLLEKKKPVVGIEAHCKLHPQTEYETPTRSHFMVTACAPALRPLQNFKCTFGTS